MTEEYNKLLDEFHKEYTISGHKKQTADHMRRDLKARFFEYLEEKDLRLEEIKVAQAQAFQGWLIEKGRADGAHYASASILRFIQSATAFYNFLKKKGRVYSNPFKEIQKMKLEKTIPQNILKEKQMNRLLEELAHFDKGKTVKEQIRKYKAHVISELMYSTGLRIHEVARMKPCDIDCERGVVYVEGGKGGRRRECFLNEYAREVVRVYIEEFYGLIFNRLSRREVVFGVCENGLTKMLNREIKKVSEELGIKKITTHGFRHSVGYHLLRSGCDIRHIQQILGHERLKNTEIYTRVEKEDLREVLDRYHPRKFRRRRDEEVG